MLACTVAALLRLLAGIDLGTQGTCAEHLDVDVAAGARLDQALEMGHRRCDLVVVQILRQQMRNSQNAPKIACFRPLGNRADGH